MITWAALKAAIEAKGVKDDDEIGRIHIYPDSPNLPKGASYVLSCEDMGEGHGDYPKIWFIDGASKSEWDGISGHYLDD